MICLTLPGPDIRHNTGYLKDHRSLIDMVELRVDYLLPNHTVEEVIQHARAIGLSTILTCRTVQDGGVFAENKERHMDILQQLVASGAFQYIDVEFDTDTLITTAKNPQALQLQAVIEQQGVQKIVSCHDFSGIPEGLQQWMHTIAKTGAIPKAAVTPKSTKELSELLTIGQSCTFPSILLGMGAYGFPSRVLYQRFHSMLTFTSPKGKEVAPGHVTPHYMHACRAKDMGASAQSAKVASFAIIGDPVLHSRSPQFHNTIFLHNQLEAGYFHFPMDSLEDGIALMNRLGLSGASITMPHKESVLPFLNHKSPQVQQIGSCNTLIRTPHGWQGFNTDYHGILQPFIDAGIELANKRVCVLGAGGAARAAVLALHHAGAHITVVNRTLSRAEQLVSHMGCGRAVSLADFVHTYTVLSTKESLPEIVVQTTSVGMDSMGNLLPHYPWHKGMVLFESIYEPKETPMVQEAKGKGARVLLGQKMFEAQAEAQSRLFVQCIEQNGGIE